MNNLNVGIIGYGRLGKMLTRYLSHTGEKNVIYEKNFKIKNLNKKILQVSLKKLLTHFRRNFITYSCRPKNMLILQIKNKLRLMKKEYTDCKYFQEEKQ